MPSRVYQAFFAFSSSSRVTGHFPVQKFNRVGEMWRCLFLPIRARAFIALRRISSVARASMWLSVAPWEATWMETPADRSKGIEGGRDATMDGMHESRVVGGGES
ncbi:hypothetical protein ACJRO7_019071 [Eucalyptus globulus]|uniref:Uncharacterized protein n=1 Tax=Eucalyptus globulus TaxID=34317 RepID=A0ABD3KZZ1_EUCGL